MTNYYLNRKSQNRKTGKIPVSTSSAKTCPNNCPFKDNGCYANGFPLKGRWQEVTEGRRGTNLDKFCHEIAALPDGQLWRHNQAGDLPGDGGKIDSGGLAQIVKANKNKRGFTFSHYDVTNKANANAIARANKNGFTINLSANNVEHADELAALNIGPVATVLPLDFEGPTAKTPQGRRIAQCPATFKDTTCEDCQLCQRVNRSVIVGFPAHGNSKRMAHNVVVGAE